MTNSAQPIIICRRGSDPLKPGYLRGQRCEVCGLELQISPSGLEGVRAGARPLCNGCGASTLELFQAMGGQVDVAISPEARKTAPGVETWDEVLARLRGERNKEGGSQS